jgi:hypothetical protein
MEKYGLAGFIFIFGLIVIAAVGLGNSDQIAPAVARAQIGMAVGEPAAEAFTGGAALVVRLLIGGVAAGVASAVFVEARKGYRLWKRQAQSGRGWKSGPNAQWQKQPSQPQLSRQDLMLLALSGKYPIEKLNRKVNVQTEDDTELEF